VKVSQQDSPIQGDDMNNKLAVLAGTMISAVWLSSGASAQTPSPAAGLRHPEHGCSAQRQHDRQGRALLHRHVRPRLQNDAADARSHQCELPARDRASDGTLPPAGAEGNFIIGPTHTPAPETSAKEGVPRGTVTTFTLSSKDSVIYNPGLIRDDVPGCGNSSIMTTTTVPGDKSNMIVTTSHPGTWTRTIEVYVPPNYVRGTEAPFIVLGDGGSTAWKDMNTTLDNLIAQRRVPPMVSIQIGNGGQDAQGAQRGREYDTVSGTYAQFVEREVLPLVEQNAGVKLTKNPEGRATMGLSSSGTAAFTMAWFHPELYRRVLAYSPTMVNQQWPWDPSLRGGAWEYHSPWAGPAGPNLTVKAGVLTPSEPPGVPLIPSAPTKPIRYWFEMGDQDLFYPNPTIPDGMHDWTLSAR
jgi:hypothetical protein